MIIERITALCSQKGITIAELERSCGIGNGVIRRWNDHNPRLDKIQAVADYFSIPLSDLTSKK